MYKTRILSLIAALTIITAGATTPASADVVYTYTGVAFAVLTDSNSQTSSFATTDFVTASFELAGYLPANQTITTYFEQNTVPISWSMSAGPVSNSSANGDTLETLAIATDGSGNIIYWDMFSVSVPFTSDTDYTNNIRTFQYSDAFLGNPGTGNTSVDQVAVFPTNSDYGNYPINSGTSATPGTWAVAQTEIPEPASLILFASGAAVLVLRRAATQRARSHAG